MVTRPSSSTRSVRPFVALAAVLALAASPACRNMPLTAPSGTAITLVATTNVLPVNGSTEVTAVLIEGGVTGAGNDSTVTSGVGTPVHNGTVVTFTTTIGRIEPAEAKTTNGRVSVRLIADGRSGKATITAFSGPASKTLEINIGAAAATLMTITASPASLGAAGGSSTITARVSDAQGNGLQGVPVSFATTKGTLSQSVTISNDQGDAATVLTTTEAADVTATSGGAEQPLTATAKVTLAPNLTVGITVPTAAITVGVPATFIVKPPTNIVVKNVSVDMGDGRTVQLGGISSDTTFQHLFAASGVLQVRATITDANNNTNSISVPVAVGPLNVSLALGTVAGIPTSPKVNTPLTFVATPTTGAQIVAYEWDFGDGSTTTTTSASVTHTYGGLGPVLITVKAIPNGGGPAAQATIAITIIP